MRPHASGALLPSNRLRCLPDQRSHRRAWEWGYGCAKPWHPPLRNLFHRYSGVTLNLIRIIYWIRYRCEVFSLASVHSQFVREGRMLSVSAETSFRDHLTRSKSTTSRPEAWSRVGIIYNDHGKEFWWDHTQLSVPWLMVTEKIQGSPSLSMSHGSHLLLKERKGISSPVCLGIAGLWITTKNEIDGNSSILSWDPCAQPFAETLCSPKAPRYCFVLFLWCPIKQQEK